MCNSGKKTLEVKIHCLSPGQNSWLREQSLQSASALDAKILATDLAWAGAHCTFGSHRESSGSQQTSPGWSLQPRGVQSPWQACKDRTKRANAPGITSVHPNIKAIQTRRKVRWLRNYPWRVKSCRSQRQTIFILMMQGILLRILISVAFDTGPREWASCTLCPWPFLLKGTFPQFLTTVSPGSQKRRKLGEEHSCTD